MSDLVKCARELAGKATPGPLTGFTAGILSGSKWVVSNLPDQYGNIMTKEDAEFFASSRTLVPELCAEVDRLRALLREARQELRTVDGGYSERSPTLQVLSRIDAALGDVGER